MTIERTERENDLHQARQVLEVAISAVDGSPQDYELYELKELLQEVLDNCDNEDDFYLELSGGECRIIKKCGIDEIWYESLKEQIKDCYDLSSISNLPDFIAVEINWDATIKAAQQDGLGHHFSSYDGEEHSTDYYYIFRTN